MDLPPPEDLQFLSIPSILTQSIQIPKSSPKTFYLITLTLVFPLSFAILAHSLFTHPLLSHLNSAPSSSTSAGDWSKLLLYQLTYLILLFALSLLSTAAVVFTVASLYTAKPVSFSSTIAALPTVLRRLFVTYLYVSLFMLIYNLILITFLVLLIIAVDEESTLLFFVAFVILLFLFLGVHVYMTALWHLASVVSVLEPIYGFSAMKKAYELLKGRTQMAFGLVFVYLAICGVITGIFGVVVVHGGENGYGTMTRIVVGGFLVGVLVIVNLVGLMVQSVFYYVCKSFHHQEIDKSALYDHLGGYLGEYVPLKSSIQMENMDV